MSISCRCCQSSLNEVVSFGKMPIANAFLKKENIEDEYFFELSAMYCPKCFLFQLKEQPDPKLLFHENYAFFAGTSMVMQKHFSDLANELLDRFKLNKNNLVLEIGNNDGGMVKYLNDIGHKNHLGVDPSKNVADSASKKGVKMLCEFFNYETAKNIKDEYGLVDYFLASNTLAHIPDINSVFSGISLLLSDDGIFITEDPYQGDLFNKISYDQIYDEHVFIFSITSMINICSKHNLKVFDVKYIPTAGGSLRYYITKKNNLPQSNELKKYIKLENDINFKSEKTYNNFYNQCESSKTKLRNLLIDLSQNNKIVSYGATSKSTTIFNYCNIDKAIISYITDTTHTKQNKLSPGMHIPIHDYEYFKNNMPEYCFLGAWNHKNEIFEKEKNNFSLKGKWLTHLDGVKIIDDIH